MTVPPQRPVVLRARAHASLRRARDALRAGELVCLPTETVYGVAALPEPGPLGRLLEAKGRPEAKGITLLIDTLAVAERLCAIPPTARRLAELHWPGPLTLVLPLRPESDPPDLLTGGRRTLGFRVPDHPVPRALARVCGPLALTSANRSGERDPRSAAEATAALGSHLALVLDDGPSPGGVPSTVVAVDAQGGIEILRAGALSSEGLGGDLER